MLPGTYKVVLPTGDVVQPWGPDVIFNIVLRGDWSKVEPSNVEPTLDKMIGSALKASPVGPLVQKIAIEPVEELTYQITITQTKQ